MPKNPPRLITNKKSYQMLQGCIFDMYLEGRKIGMEDSLIVMELTELFPVTEDYIIDLLSCPPSYLIKRSANVVLTVSDRLRAHVREYIQGKHEYLYSTVDEKVLYYIFDVIPDELDEAAKEEFKTQTVEIR
jgi:hypothetical protein